ncbi:sensor histidine kinase [Cytobacillus praedii]|uniref:histidine kinase n=1 Tax=Cytobacillus praedii TaxID=1742358 RepID=A0A4R1AYT3_9BACI|nr:ATP-binding protein [Cytobacillus praedii]TCJ05796.1 HAMP domain-containing protein [Cytobacillus praedii]
MKSIIYWLHSQPMRVKVLVFGIIMSTIPLLLISYYYYSNVKPDLEERIISKQELVLQNLTGEIELEFNQIFQQVQMFSIINDKEDKQPIFYDLLMKNTSIEEVVIINESGRIEEKVSRYDLNILESNERWFSDEMWDVFQSDDRIYGEVEFNQFGQPVMKIALVYRENERRNAVGVTIQLQKIIGQISSLKQDDLSYLYLLDREGKVIAHQDYRKLWHQSPEADNKEMLGVREELVDLGWTIIMEQPKTTAYEPINDMFMKGLMVAVIVTLFVSLISIYAGLYFTAPIVLLDKEMRRLKAGHVASPIILNRNDELGQLSQSFNEMSQELQEKSFRLKQEKERLDVVVNGIGAGLALVTKNYEVTWTNPLLESWMSKEEIELPCYTLIGGMNTPCDNCPITCPEINENADTIMRMQRGNREERLFRHRVFPLTHAIKGEGEYLIVIEDVTEEKQMEEKMIQTDKLSALGLMASSFAHEVNNPLATIHVYAEDLIDRLEQYDDDLDEVEMALYLRKIKENTDRCKRITGNLLNFSRKSNWKVSQFDIKEIIQNSISLVEYSLKKKNVLLDVSIQEEMPYMAGDSIKLMQVLVNLINNSIDAINQDGTVAISAFQQNRNFVFKIKDNGCGIPDHEMQKIFDPFFTTKPVGKGTGLGLSVCYGIIEEFGGTIMVESKVGKGTMIIVSIPAETRFKEDKQ